LWRTIAIVALPSTTCSGTALQCVQVNTAATVSVCRCRFVVRRNDASWPTLDRGGSSSPYLCSKRRR
jgi:hypothetical protein